ncbi:MAG: hypothetical protein NVSMB39_2590 [Candidatus Saccharimonadales bacterium]
MSKTWWDFDGNVIFAATLTRQNSTEVLENLMSAVEAKCRPDQVLTGDLIAAIAEMVDLLRPRAT